jgi:GNAT superfamily N-acetyltransferase
MNTRIVLAKEEREILECYSEMAQLRPHIKREEFLPRVKELAKIADFQMAYLDDNGVRAVAGFRISEWLARGKYLEIEDLVSKNGERSKGYGAELFDWLVNYAREHGCVQVRLVSHVKRFDAHRFYLNRRMIIEAHYFSLALK